MEHEDRWHDLNMILRRPSPLAGPEFQPDTEEDQSGLNFLREESKILCIGAGGLGCDLLKCMALSGFKHVEVIDMDHIDATNLNRQFLFREKDVGSSKAKVASEFVNKRVYDTQIDHFHGMMQEKDISWYKKFDLIVCGLDSLEARRWINFTLFKILELDEKGVCEGKNIPMIEAGTEGLEGQISVIYPGVTACTECNLMFFPKTDSVPICTIAGKPRKPEHCVLYAGLIAFDEKQKCVRKSEECEELKWGPPFLGQNGKPLEKWDSDEPEQMKWLWQVAQAHARNFDLDDKEVTFKLTKNVLKNTIPAIASTNAVVAAISAHEAFKLVTGAAPVMDNYVRWNGKKGIFSNSQKFVKNEMCAACGKAVYRHSVSGETTLEEFFEEIKKDSRFQFLSPAAKVADGDLLYVGGPFQLENHYRPNLKKPLKELLVSGDVLILTDSKFNFGKVEFKITLL